LRISENGYFFVLNGVLFLVIHIGKNIHVALDLRHLQLIYFELHSNPLQQTQAKTNLSNIKSPSQQQWQTSVRQSALNHYPAHALRGFLVSKINKHLFDFEGFFRLKIISNQRTKQKKSIDTKRTLRLNNILIALALITLYIISCRNQENNCSLIDNIHGYFFLIKTYDDKEKK
jgi:hypothetical protein